MFTITAQLQRTDFDDWYFDQPFRHEIIDNWASPELVRAAEAEWPDELWPFWYRYDNGKLTTKDPLRIPPACNELVRRRLCLPISELMGIENAIFYFLNGVNFVNYLILSQCDTVNVISFQILYLY